MIKLTEAKNNKKLKMLLGAGLAALLLAGCGGATDVAGTFISAGQKPIEVSPETFAPPVPCPPMELKLNTFLIRKFERGKEDNPDALLYQATIEDWANTCTREGTDQRRIKMGLSGDVTPGPAWKGGEIVLPIRVAVLPRSGADVKPIISELLQVPVTIGANSPSEQWTLIEEKYVISQDQPAKIVFGFDEGKRR